jgi:succinate dehydrogenase / fumarate reductase flavoprotein subunit
LGVFLDFADSIKRLGENTIRERYGNLFDMYEQITGENAYQSPMRIFPAVHYTMGGLWVDYDLMSNVPGLFVLGEANFSDHGANRLGASALMQGLADGYFVIPATIGNYLSTALGKKPADDHPEFKKAEEQVQNRIKKFLSIKGRRTVDSFHRELGLLMWDLCGMARSEKSLSRALNRIPTLRAEFWENVNVADENPCLNSALEKAGRVADFLEFGELMCLDAFERRESCGGHFREEFQYPDGEAKRDDEHFCHVAAWQHTGDDCRPNRIVEPLVYESVKPSVRSYK